MNEILLRRVYDDFDGKFLYEELLSDVPDNGGTQPASGDVVYIAPLFALGAASAQPSVGSGKSLGWYVITDYSNVSKVDLWLYIESKGGSAGAGTGGYEVYLSDDLEPEYDWYSGHANLWIAGGGISEFDGSVKWTSRNDGKGMKMIFTFDGKEWNPGWPKAFADFKLRASISYFL